MTITRRDFLRTGSTLAAASLIGTRAWARFQPATTQPKPGAPAGAAARYFEWKKAADGVHVAFGEGGNALVMLGAGGALLIDCKNAGFGDELRREAASLGAPLAMVINSHHHADHTGGNSAFTADLTVLAHAKAKLRIAGNVDRYASGAKGTVGSATKSSKPGAAAIVEDAKKLTTRIEGLKDQAKVAALFEPTKTTEGNETMTVGGKKVELHHVGAGHTDNDIFVFLPDFNVLHTGDLLFHKWWPYMDRPAGCDSAGWVRSCDKILEVCNDKTVVVPGHGEITDRSGVQGQIDFFKKMRSVAATAVKAGVTKEDFLKQPPPEEYKNYDMASFIQPITLGALYDEAAGAPAK